MTIRLQSRVFAPIDTLPTRIAARPQRKPLGLLSASRAALGAFGLFASLLLAGSGLAGTTEIPYGRGLLWQVERAGHNPSFVFGTIHLGGERILNLPRPVREAFNTARSACFELIVDNSALRQASARTSVATGRRLDEVLGPDLYAEVVQAALPHGLTPRELRDMQPWAVLMVMRRQASDERIADDNVPLDLWLQFEAQRRGKALCALETIEEQMAVFDDLPDELHQALMRAMVDAEKHPAPPNADGKNHLDETVELYLEGKIGRLLEISRRASNPAEQQLVDILIDRLLNRRNQIMVRRMGPQLVLGGAFIAVGAAHLPGEAGILSLLASQGYVITRLY